VAGKLKPLDIERLTKPGKYADSDGLYLIVAGPAAKSWSYRYWRDIHPPYPLVNAVGNTRFSTQELCTVPQSHGRKPRRKVLHARALSWPQQLRQPSKNFIAP
jgi:hypothetical protein